MRTDVPHSRICGTSTKSAGNMCVAIPAVVLIANPPEYTSSKFRSLVMEKHCCLHCQRTATQLQHGVVFRRTTILARQTTRPLLKKGVHNYFILHAFFSFLFCYSCQESNLTSPTFRKNSSWLNLNSNGALSLAKQQVSGDFLSRRSLKKGIDGLYSTWVP
jgi:hypothetical protein